jgi:hypothetical protein
MKILLFAFCFLNIEFCSAQQHKTENLIIVTLDGLRSDQGTADPIKSIFY